MRRIAWGTLRTLTSTAGAIVLGLGMAGACSQGEQGGGSYTGFPQGPGGPQTSGNTSNSSATFGVDAGGSGAAGGSCCVANNSPGCDDEFIQACVCVDDISCCSEEWTSDCARMVDDLGCGQCQGSPDTGADVDPDTGPAGQDCCVGGPNPGCNDPDIAACVCDQIEFCCDTNWAQVCVDAVDALGCPRCDDAEDETGEEPPPGDSTGEEPPPPPPPGMGDCCEPQMGPGCGDAAIQACVCMMDAFCCDDTWDQLCVDQVGDFMCGMDCGEAPPPPPPPPEASTCCSAQMSAGCDTDTAEVCVCLFDSYCCETMWDDACVLLNDLLPCGADC